MKVAGAGMKQAWDETDGLEAKVTRRHHSANLVSNAAHFTMIISTHASKSHHAKY
jgi:hypothetical protein